MHLVIIPHDKGLCLCRRYDNSVLRDEVRDWMKQNVAKGSWNWFIGIDGLHFNFVREVDAVIFKMRWG
jgi:hypothetical protein